MSISEVEDAPFVDPALCIPPRHPDHQSPHEKTLVLGCILSSIFFERIVYYSLVANLSATLEASKVLG